jgi:hypothetical protein|tara:strand:+ start:1242 stop:1505 length:264 start_codon:yes stop_codon:yes gene_type:complete
MVATAVPKRPPVGSPVLVSTNPALRPHQNAETIATLITKTGAHTLSIPTATPAMMLVPCPVVDAAAICRTGGYFERERKIGNWKKVI